MAQYIMNSVPIAILLMLWFSVTCFCFMTNESLVKKNQVQLNARPTFPCHTLQSLRLHRGMNVTSRRNINNKIAANDDYQTSNNKVHHGILQQFINAAESNTNTEEKKDTLSACIEDSLDLCDYGFLMFLNDEIAKLGPDSAKGKVLVNISIEINGAMQRRLVRADSNLRSILGFAPDLKQMEKKLGEIFRIGQADIAFLVTLNMNIEKAKEAGDQAVGAVSILTHINTKLMELQDQRMPRDVQLLRKLIRSGNKNYTKLLQEELIFPGNESKGKVLPSDLKLAISELMEQALQVNNAAVTYQSDLIEDLEKLLIEVDSLIAN